MADQVPAPPQGEVGRVLNPPADVPLQNAPQNADQNAVQDEAQNAAGNAAPEALDAEPQVIFFSI